VYMIYFYARCPFQQGFARSKTHLDQSRRAGTLAIQRVRHPSLYTSLTRRLGISVSTISNPLRLGYRLLNVSMSHSSPVPSTPVVCGSGLSLAELGFVGEFELGPTEPLVCKFFGFGGKRGAGPDGARTLIAGGAEEDGMGGGGMFGRTEEGLA
jgi:hypothetical protein